MPDLAAGQEQPFAPKCGQIGAKTYEFKRTINLPGRYDLEEKVRQKISGVDAEIRKRLNKGVVFTHLPISQVEPLYSQITARPIPSVPEFDQRRSASNYDEGTRVIRNSNRFF